MAGRRRALALSAVAACVLAGAAFAAVSLRSTAARSSLPALQPVSSGLSVAPPESRTTGRALFPRAPKPARTLVAASSAPDYASAAVSRRSSGGQTYQPVTEAITRNPPIDVGEAAAREKQNPPPAPTEISEPDASSQFVQASGFEPAGP